LQHVIERVNLFHLISSSRVIDAVYDKEYILSHLA